MSKYAEVRSDFFDEIEEVQTVDAWMTSNDNEEGRVIAKVHLDTKQVEYIDADARYDDYAQEVISEVLSKGYSLTE